MVKAKGSLTYISWPCGSGKTTCMLELGNMLAHKLMPSRRAKKPVYVKLVVANTDLVSYYQNLFTEKQSLADPKINFEWQSVATFKQRFIEDPGKEVTECLVIDEGDLVLDREMNRSWNVACHKHILLLSAVPKESWNGT